MRVRPLAVDAADAVAHVAQHGAVRWSARAWASTLARPGVLGWGHGDPLDAYLILQVVADEAEILDIAVHPEHRRAGVARALWSQARGELARRRVLRVALEVSEHRAPARAFYAGLGFVPAGRRRAYYADGSDALVLVLEPLC